MRRRPATPATLAGSAKVRLLGVASTLVGEYKAGKWPELSQRSRRQVMNFLLDELLRRCPDFSTRDYRIALSARLAGRRAPRRATKIA